MGKKTQHVQWKMEEVRNVSKERSMLKKNSLIKKDLFITAWCDSMDWVPACEPKVHWFNSQSGHMPGLWARSPGGGVLEATIHRCFPLSLSLPLSKNKRIKPFKNSKIGCHLLLLPFLVLLVCSFGADLVPLLWSISWEDSDAHHGQWKAQGRSQDWEQRSY